MYKKLLLSFFPILAFVMLTSEQFSDDGRAGFTGSPGEDDCTNCHNSFAVNTGGGTISLQVPGMTGNEYVPGQTYSLSVTVSRSANNLFGFGFEALNTLLDNSGNLIITDVASTQIKTRVVNGITKRNVVHTLNGGASTGSKTFNFDWTAPTTGSGPVTFYFAGVAANGNGEDDNDYVYKSSLTVTEFVCLPPAQPAVVSGNPKVCKGSSQNYSVNPVSGATSYTWVLPSGWTGSSTGNSITVQAGNNGGNLSVTANNNCGSSTPRTLAVISSSPVVNAVPSHVLCFGGNTGSAGSIVTGGIAPFSYQWNTNPPQITSTAGGLSAGSYQVIISDSIGCKDTASVTINQPASLPVANAGNDQTVCEGTVTSIGGIPPASGGTLPYSYTWSPSTGLNDTSDGNPQLTASANITYTLLLSDANSCSSSDSLTLTVLPAPKPMISMVNDTLYASGSGNFQWYIDGIAISGKTDPFIIPGTPGQYSVEISYLNGCSNTSDPYLFNPVGINSMNWRNTLRVYPNPVKDELKIMFNFPPGNLNLSLFDMSGRKFMEVKPARPHLSHFILDCSVLEDGIYILYVENDNKIVGLAI
jgi:hypothetical protein